MKNAAPKRRREFRERPRFFCPRRRRPRNQGQAAANEFDDVMGTRVFARPDAPTVPAWPTNGACRRSVTSVAMVRFLANGGTHPVINPSYGIADDSRLCWVGNRTLGEC